MIDMDFEDIGQKTFLVKVDNPCLDCMEEDLDQKTYYLMKMMELYLPNLETCSNNNNNVSHEIC